MDMRTTSAAEMRPIARGLIVLKTNKVEKELEVRKLDWMCVC